MDIFHQGMEKIKIMPSITDNTGNLHKPSVISRLFFHYGCINAFDMPIARKHRLTGKVEYRRYNTSFQYWSWEEVNDKYKTAFVAIKYWP